MTLRPLSITITLALILLNGLVWLVFGTIVAAGLHPTLPDSRLMQWTMAILAFVTAGVLIALSIFLHRKSSVAYALTLALLILIAMFTALDEVGWADLIVLGIDVVPIVLLIRDRAWYLRPRSRVVDRTGAA